MGFAFRSSIVGVGEKESYSSLLITDHHPNRCSQCLRVKSRHTCRLAGAVIAGTASALDAKTFFEQVDRDHN